MTEDRGVLAKSRVVFPADAVGPKIPLRALSRIFTQRGLIASLLACVAMVAVGYSAGSYYQFVLSIIAINAMVVISLDILLGRLGLISIGHAGFVCAGAYVSAVLMTNGWPFLATLPAAGALASFGGLLLGLPSMRLSGFYLAVATLAFGGLMLHVVRWLEPLTGGVYGMAVPIPTAFGFKLTGGIWFAFLVGTLVLFILSHAWLARSVLGRAMLAVKSSEPAAQSIGINFVTVKLIGFAISGFSAGIAGALYGPTIGFLGTEHFTFMVSVSYVAMAVVGGVGTLGAILGAAVITAIPEFFTALADFGSLIWGVALLLILLLSPGGLAALRIFRNSVGSAAP